MAQLGRKPLEARSGQGDGLEQLGVTITWHDLGGDGFRLQPKPRQNPLLELRGRGRVGADGPGERADRRLRERPLEPLCVTVGLEGVARELDAERRRLGVDAMGAPDA